MLDLHIAKNKDIVLAVSYGDYQIMHGGVSRYLMDYTNNLLENDISVIFFYPKTIKNLSGKTMLMKYGCKVDDKDIKGAYDIAGIISIVDDNINKEKKLREFHIHHLKDVDLEDIDCLLRNYNFSTRYFIHDYYCIATNYVEGIDYQQIHMTDHYNAYREFFDRRTIDFIAPSKVAAGVFKKAFELKKDVKVIPHQKCSIVAEGCSFEREDSSDIRVAYIGNTNREKGYEYWLEALNNKANGVTYIEYSNAKNSKNAILKSGYYQPNDLKYMVKSMKDDKIDIVVLWSICKETYSYTFFEALEAGIVIITNWESGNIAAMVEEYNAGEIYDKSELKNILCDYYYLYTLLGKNKNKDKFRVEFNPEIIELVKQSQSVSIGKTYLKNRRKKYIMFSAIYNIYNWLRVKVIKV